MINIGDRLRWKPYSIKLHASSKINSNFELFCRSTNEVREIHKDQMNEMEIRLSNSKQSENILLDEISKIKNDYHTQTAKHEAEQARSQQIIKDQSIK